MRSGHGCAAGSCITTIAGIVARARSCSWSSDIRLCTIATISRNWAAAAKASNGIRSGIQCPYSVGGLIKRRWIGHRGTTGARVARSHYHLDTSSFLSFNSSLQLVADNATLRGGATPGVSRYIRRQGRVPFVGRAVERVRREEKFHALDVPGWCAVSLIHVTAAYPFCARRWRAGLQGRFRDRASFRKVIVNVRVACDACHVRTGRQRFGKLAVSFHQNCVNDIERLILDVAITQPLKDWPLGALGLFQQGLMNEAALFGFSWQISGRTQISLICQQDKKFSLLSVGSVFHYPRRDLLYRRRMKRALRRQLNA